MIGRTKLSVPWNHWWDHTTNTKRRHEEFAWNFPRIDPSHSLCWHLKAYKAWGIPGTLNYPTSHMSHDIWCSVFVFFFLQGLTKHPLILGPWIPLIQDMRMPILQRLAECIGDVSQSRVVTPGRKRRSTVDSDSRPWCSPRRYGFQWMVLFWGKI